MLEQLDVRDLEIRSIVVFWDLYKINASSGARLGEDVWLAGKVATNCCIDDHRLRGEELAEVASCLGIEGRREAPTSGIRRVCWKVGRNRLTREEPNGDAGCVPQRGVYAASVLGERLAVLIDCQSPYQQGRPFDLNV